MNSIRNPFTLGTALILALVAGCFTACKTTSPETIQAVAAATQIAVKDGTFLYTAEHPESRPQFQTAANTLRALSTTETLNFSAALNVLRQLPIKEVQDPMVQIIVSDADIILTYLNVTVPLTEVEHLRPIVVALAQGIEDGLAMQTPRDITRPVKVVGRDGEILNR
jgi:hypothetical protein